MKKKLRLATLSCISMAMFGVTSLAAETSMSVKAGGTYSDNVRRSQTLEDSETLGIIGLTLAAEQDEGKLVGSLKADLELQKFMDDTFDNENSSTLAALAEFRMVPDRFSWVIQENFGRTISNPFRTDTPANREWVNSFATGPDLQMQFGPRTTMRIEGRLIQNDFETSNVDNQVTSGTVSLIRAVSPTRSVSLNVNGARVEFDDMATNGAFDRQSAYIGLQSRLARSNLSVNLGFNEIHDRGETNGGLLAAVNWTRELTGSSSFSGSFNQRYAEAGELFRYYQSSGRDFNRTQDISALGGPLQNQGFELKYNFSRESNQGYLGVSWNDDDFEYSNSYDRQRKGLNAGIRRTITDNWQVGGDIRVEQHDFQHTGSSYDETRLGATLTRRLTGKLNLNLTAERLKRDAEGAANGYSENRFSVFLNYAVR